MGVIVGSSELGLSQEEFEALSWQEQQEKCKKTAQRFLDAGADKVVYTLEELAEFLGHNAPVFYSYFKGVLSAFRKKKIPIRNITERAPTPRFTLPLSWLMRETTIVPAKAAPFPQIS